MQVDVLGAAATIGRPGIGSLRAAHLIASGYIAIENDVATPTSAGLAIASEVPPQPSTSAEPWALWCFQEPAQVSAETMVKLL